MATSPVSKAVQHLRSAALLHGAPGVTDEELLRRFAANRDEAAFAALVRRHGRLVWGVCRRVLRNHHDAEDAFQAAFLVLARKAASIASRHLLANWLYGVAYRTALKAKAMATKQRAREREAGDMPRTEAAGSDAWHDLLPLLDQELNRLPEKYRLPILLCDLEGKGRKEAAKQLGWPEGTVAGRLARGRALLAKRLARHAPALFSGALAALLSQEAASATPPVSVLTSMAKAGSLLAAGHLAAAGVLSPAVAALAEGVLKAMLLTKLKTAAGVLFILAVTSLGAVVLTCQAGTMPASALAPAPEAESGVVRVGERYAFDDQEIWSRGYGSAEVLKLSGPWALVRLWEAERASEQELWINLNQVKIIRPVGGAKRFR